MSNCNLNWYSITSLFLLNFTTHYLLMKRNFTLQMIYSQLIYKKNSVHSRTNKTNGWVHTLVWHDDFLYKCSCVCASTFTVASYILILNSKRKLVTETPLKQEMRIDSFLFHIFQHLTLEMNQNKNKNIHNEFVFIEHITYPFVKFYFRMLILEIKWFIKWYV